MSVDLRQLCLPFDATTYPPSKDLLVQQHTHQANTVWPNHGIIQCIISYIGT